MFLEPFRRPILIPQISFERLYEKTLKLFKMSSNASALQETYFIYRYRYKKYINIYFNKKDKHLFIC